ncbi:MAG TPA: GNAT family N-acetyltransferase [Chitinophagaceae bacterium]|jgi:putative acetyltransferase|nr:GNAT family N-acetyltransferase [Chitinophagaceae bacterium]
MEIINFERRYENDFRQLNLEWLYKYNLAESHDLEVLNDPTGTIIDRGGCIFLAKEDDVIAGTAALMKERNNVYELAKMTVAKDFRGKGISKLLMNRCIEEAKKLGAKKLMLFSNHQLETALALYRQFGFKDIPVDDSPFETADVKMELVL